MPDVAFFVTGQGRSGTRWLTRLLDEDERLRVYHEPLHRDASAYVKIYNGTLNARRYLWKRWDMMTAFSMGKQGAYGEVNSYLRYCVLELREVFNVPVIGLVRDGRATVRSLLNRGIYQVAGKPNIMPHEQILRNEWTGWDRYAKACWYWADTYRRLSAQDVEIFKLERLNEDYEYFARLCGCINVRVGKDAWARHAGVPINVGTTATRMTQTRQQRMDFEMLAGDVQRRLGYKL